MYTLELLQAINDWLYYGMGDQKDKIAERINNESNGKSILPPAYDR